jgi:hypothetical protein
MRALDELRALANENFITSFATLAQNCPDGECLWFEDVFVYRTGVPIGLFNGCVALGGVDSHNLAAGIAWLQSSGVVHTVFLTEDSALVGLVQERGYLLDPEPYPGMTLHPIGQSPPRRPGVTVDAIEIDERDRYLAISREMGLEPELAERLYSRDFVADPKVHLFVGCLDGRTVGKAIAIESESTCGVYDVATLDSAMRQGVGTALTWAAITAGQEAGFDTIVLQSSPMGYSLYSEIGFRTVSPYMAFDSPG